MHTSQTEIAYFKKQIKQKLSHTYLHRFLGDPIIDSEKLSMLISIMDRTILPQRQKENYIVTTMLVQLALDTHDCVPVQYNSKKHDRSQIDKQLTVLAGDYYSGLYYFLLAETEAYAMIRTLATAIKEINEYKMRLYDREIKSEAEWIHTIKKIESALFTHILSYLELDSCKYPVEEWLLIHKLIRERDSMRVNGQSSPVLNEWFLHDPDVNGIKILEDMIDTRIKQLKNSIPLQTLEKSPSVIQEFLRETYTSDMEEG